MLALAAAYYVAGRIGLELAYLDGAVAALWPPVGIGIAALLLYGTRLWPGVVIGDLLLADWSQPLGTVLGQVVGNTLAVVVVALALSRTIGTRPLLDRRVEVLALVAGSLLAAVISAAFGPLSLRLGGVISAGELGRVLRTWTLSDLAGALVVAPVILAWVGAGLAGLRRRDALEALALLALVVAIAEVPAQRDVPYVVFPVLLWTALRFGPRGASTAVLVVCSLTVWNTAQQEGPFVRESITHSLLASQLFIAIAALTSLLLAAVTAERARSDVARRANEERLRSVVGSMAEGLIVRDASGRITDCNAAAEEITGVPGERLRGHRPHEALRWPTDSDGAALAPERLLGEQTLLTGVPQAGVVARLERGDDAPAWVAVSSGAVRDAAGRPVGVVSTLSDITRLWEAEQQLRASEAAHRALADEQAALRRVATLVAGEADPASVFEQVAAEVGRLLGAPSAGLVRYEDARSALVVAAWSEAGASRIPVGSTVTLKGDGVIARVYASGLPQRADYERAAGPLVETLRGWGYRSAVAAPVFFGGRLWGALAALTMQAVPLAAGAERRLSDFAELVAQALANADAYEKLAASRARIVEAGDAERRRLERNLHDGAQQRLVALALALRLVDGKLDSDPATARRILASAQQDLDHALEELRELARGIHPAVLSDRGLAPALKTLVARVPVPVELAELPDESLPEPVEAAAYYVIAEALTNVAKYARASSARVSVRHEDSVALVEVADDGVGGADPARGSGLRGLADRVEALDGRLGVDSPPSGGTRITAEIPVP